MIEAIRNLIYGPTTNVQSLQAEHTSLLDSLAALRTRAEASRDGVRSQLQTLTIELAAHNDLIGKLNG